MKNKEEYGKIKAIFEGFEDVSINQRQGAHFKFQIYMTPVMAKTPIEALDLSVRATNCLRRAQIDTIGDLCNRITCSSDLRSLRNCGTSSIIEIMDSLFAYNYSQLPADEKEKYLLSTMQLNKKENVAF